MGEKAVAIIGAGIASPSGGCGTWFGNPRLLSSTKQPGQYPPSKAVHANGGGWVCRPPYAINW